MKSKAKKPVELPKFGFIRYHSDWGCYTGIIKYGRKTDKFVCPAEFPLKVWMVKENERKYYSSMGTVAAGVLSLRLVAERNGINKGAAEILNEAQTWANGKL